MFHLWPGLSTVKPYLYAPSAIFAGQQPGGENISLLQITMCWRKPGVGFLVRRLVMIDHVDRPLSGRFYTKYFCEVKCFHVACVVLYRQKENFFCYLVTFSAECSEQTDVKLIKCKLSSDPIIMISGPVITLVTPTE